MILLFHTRSNRPVSSASWCFGLSNTILFYVDPIVKIPSTCTSPTDDHSLTHACNTRPLGSTSSDPSHRLPFPLRIPTACRMHVFRGVESGEKETRVTYCEADCNRCRQVGVLGACARSRAALHEKRLAAFTCYLPRSGLA
jgi:hypothetical protein